MDILYPFFVIIIMSVVGSLVGYFLAAMKENMNYLYMEHQEEKDYDIDLERYLFDIKHSEKSYFGNKSDDPTGSRIETDD